MDFDAFWQDAVDLTEPLRFGGELDGEEIEALCRRAWAAGARWTANEMARLSAELAAGIEPWQDDGD